jgi:hypothetical protein
MDFKGYKAEVLLIITLVSTYYLQSNTATKESRSNLAKQIISKEYKLAHFENLGNGNLNKYSKDVFQGKQEDHIVAPPEPFRSQTDNLSSKESDKFNYKNDYDNLSNKNYEIHEQQNDRVIEKFNNNDINSYESNDNLTPYTNDIVVPEKDFKNPTPDFSPLD